MNKYDTWIANYTGDIFRKCVEVTLLMKNEFPELERVKGFVYIADDCMEKQYPHMWLKDKNGNIIDPTAKQWIGIIQYNEYNVGDLIPIGKCMNCGKQIIGEIGTYKDFCDDVCYKKFEEYLNN